VPFTSAKSTEFRRVRLFVGEMCVRYILGPSFARFHRLLEYVGVMGVPCHGICVGLLVIGAKGVYRVVLLRVEEAIEHGAGAGLLRYCWYCQGRGASGIG